TLELSIAGKGIEKIKEKLWFDQESLRTQLMYHDLPVPDPKEVPLNTLKDTIDKIRDQGGDLRAGATTMLQQLPQEQREGTLWTLAMKPFDETQSEVRQMMFPMKLEFMMSDYEKNQVKQMTLALVQAALGELGPGKGNSLLGSDGDDKPTQVTHNGKTYNQVRQLGEGGFGVAFLFRSDDNDEIVVKQFKRDYHTDPFLSPKEVEDAEVEWFGKMQDEIRIHRYAMGKTGEGHENVLGLKGMITRPPTGGERFGELFTITEVAKGGEMRDTMERLHQQLQDKRISKTVGDLLNRQLFAQTIEGMHYVQKERQMLHLDLKPENIFLTSDGTVKVADFGLSHIGHVSDHIGGTLLYMAPEGVEGSGLDLKSDSWTLGVICRELLTGQLGLVKHGQDAPEPTTMEDLEDRLQDYTSNTNNRVYRSEQQDGINPTELTNSKGEDVSLKNLGGFHQMINAMMHPDPTQRPTLEAIRRHEYVSDPMLQMPQLKELISKLAVSTKNMDVNQLKVHNEEIERLSKEIEQLAKR
ncbi:MAG: protein kinase, partial [Candidatus Sericytochromatia bacterium]